MAYRVHRGIELFGRVANAFDADYKDVVGYRTEGRSALCRCPHRCWPLAPALKVASLNLCTDELLLLLAAPDRSSR